MAPTPNPSTENTGELERLRARLTRREDRARVKSDVRIQRISRRAELAGQQARTRHEVAQSGEARALRVERTRSVALAALLPVLCAFGAWSAAGVQAGMVNLLNLEADSAAAGAAWLVEPALLGIVAGVILIRARLQSAGGDLDERATYIEIGALATSIILNAAGHWPKELDASGLAALAGHALGPLGAAATAYLISVIQDGVAKADPWTLKDGTQARSLAQERTTSAPASAPGGAFESAPEQVAKSAAVEALPPALEWVRVPEGARRLDIVARPARQAPAQRSASASRTGDEQHQQPSSQALVEAAPRRSRSARPNRGAKVPEVAKSASESSARALSDADLADRLSALVAAGDVEESAPVRRIQGALGIGFERAKRVLALREESTETVTVDQLSVVDAAKEAPDITAVDRVLAAIHSGQVGPEPTAEEAATAADLSVQEAAAALAALQTPAGADEAARPRLSVVGGEQ